ncbi:sulfurtransferase [Tissierella sp. MB52-C2]|uniref:sulfurtransferase n=1 Tax=Tissierella sp. MB52-C2 TaxID=3070999 RepID=UPI00280AFCE4|nr:sulfurtransferase [Tissierella sp. MB52-C2]WMM25286.1 sulfurtransferase [Tissierella sp. MB52-C2]
MKNIISQEWLKNNISKEDLIILDTRAELNDPSYGFNEYNKGHIKGAQFVSMEEVMTGELREHGGRHPLPNMDEFIENMKSLGIEDNSTVVIYDDGELAMAGRLWWILKYSGKNKVYVLEGGIKSWVENDLELTTEIPKVKKSNSLTLNLAPSMEVDMDYVKKVITDKDIAIIDSRAYERYIGKIETIDKVAGHIPSALNYPWTNLVEDGIKPKEELEEYFKPLKDYKEVIVHCGSGITGTVNLMFMEEIGLKPKFYVGGYSDWISYEDNEIVEGDK